LEERFTRQLAISDRRQTPEWQAQHSDRVAKMLEFNRASAEIGSDDPDRARGAALQLEARRGHDTWDRLSSLSLPVLLAAGRHDGIAPLENMQRMGERIRGSELRVYDGGHLFLLQDRSAYPDIVRWLEG
jgi:3-oxoadipate enol-lactonase